MFHPFPAEWTNGVGGAEFGLYDSVSQFPSASFNPLRSKAGQYFTVMRLTAEAVDDRPVTLFEVEVTGQILRAKIFELKRCMAEWPVRMALGLFPAITDFVTVFTAFAGEIV